MKNDLLKKYNNIFNVLTEVKGYVGADTIEKGIYFVGTQWEYDELGEMKKVQD